MNFQTAKPSSVPREYPFVRLNCARDPHRASRKRSPEHYPARSAAFELANKGTLFLHEVGEIPLDLQPKLLRAL
jgi:DNA-binding NtrC family response regulator